MMSSFWAYFETFENNINYSVPFVMHRKIRPQNCPKQNNEACSLEADQYLRRTVARFRRYSTTHEIHK